MKIKLRAAHRGLHCSGNTMHTFVNGLESKIFLKEKIFLKIDQLIQENRV